MSVASSADLPKLTLTFDNGPTPGVTEGVLECLAKADVPATFFVIGRKLLDPERRALASRAKAAGHWIGNHTFTHTCPLGLLSNRKAEVDEIAMAEDAIGDLAQPQPLFRPYGDGGKPTPALLSPAAVDHLKRKKYRCVIWNCVPHDWSDTEGWPERALAHCQSTAWTLLVVHDLPTGAMKQLPRFLDMVRSEGIEIRQDFPPDCVLVRDGKAAPSIGAFVSDPKHR